MTTLVRGVLIAALVLVAAACPGEETPPPAQTPAETPTPTPTETPDDEGFEMELEAEDIAFDEDTLSAPAGAQVALELNNRDSVPHNFALYEEEGADEAIFTGDLLQGPGRTTYRFEAPADAGSYYFQCDVHPEMNGTFEVT